MDVVGKNNKLFEISLHVKLSHFTCKLLTTQKSLITHKSNAIVHTENNLLLIKS